MKTSFALDKQTSPLSRITAAETVCYPEAEYMALIKFNSCYLDFDLEKNNAPVLYFEGEVEQLDAIDTKFPHNIDTIYFTNNKPPVRYKYEFSKEQFSELAKKGFWNNGVTFDNILTTAKFQLETYAVVEEVKNSYEDTGIPVITVDLTKPYENTFNESAYDIIQYIHPKTPEAAVEVAQTKKEYVAELDVQADIEAAKEALAKQREAEQQATYKPLTKEELDMQSKSANVGSYVDAIRENIEKTRADNNAKVEAEREKQRQAEAENANSDSKKNPDVVSFGETKKTNEIKVEMATEEDKYESNSDVFAAANEEQVDSADMPYALSEFMKKLDEVAETQFESSDNKGSNNSSGSGAASGATGLKGYTFEDESTAQHEMRQDEGKGNEKSEDQKDAEEKEEQKEENQQAQNETKAESDMARKKAQLASSIHDTTVSVAPDRDDRSK